MRPMRIVMLSDNLPPEYSGGAEKVTWRLAKGLSAAGHHIDAIAATHGETRAEQHEGIGVHWLKSRPVGRFQSWRTLYHPGLIPRLGRLLRDLRPDVVSVQNVQNYISFAALAAAHAAGASVVFTANDVMTFAYGKLTHHVSARFDADHLPAAADYRLSPGYNLRTMRFRFNPVRNIVIRYLVMRHSDARVCLSLAHQRTLEGNGLPGFRVVYPGLEDAAFHVDPVVVRSLAQRLGLDGYPVALFGDRLSRDKGIDVLYLALREVVKRVPDTRLLILGGIRKSPEDIPEDLRPYVVWTGWLEEEELSAAYALSRVTLMPSLCFESAGMMALESMAAGTPVIGSPFGALPELIAHNETGYIVNPLDTTAFAGALAHLLRDEVASSMMGKAGRARVASRFALADQVRVMEQIFSDVMSRSDRRK